MRQRRRRHERPGFINDGAVLATVNAAFRAACGGGLTASVDRRCARRLPKLRPGRRNAAQPDKETFRSPLRRERRSIRRFSGRMTPPTRSGVPAGTMDWVRPHFRSVVLGASPATPPYEIGPAPSFSDTIRRQPSADPVQKHDPGSGYGAKKGLTAEGPLQKRKSNCRSRPCTRARATGSYPWLL
jgi:hypothetical protein